MYDSILRGLFCLQNKKTEEEQREYLKELLDPLRQLRAAYRKKGAVNVSYCDQAVQACYLLNYFPRYCALTCDALDLVYTPTTRVALDQDLIQASFFACGPAPELCGLMLFLRDFPANTQRILAH